MANHSEDKGFWSRLFGPLLTQSTEEQSNGAMIPQTDNARLNGSSQSYSNSSGWYPVNTYGFDGEKTIGEMGPPIDLVPEHNGLRLRAYEAQLKSDIIKMITGKFFKWVIGNGLKLQSEPEGTVLKSEGINEDLIPFKKLVEARFKVYTDSKMSDYSKMANLHRRANEAFKTAFLSGDCLVVMRVENGMVNIQIVDGSEIKTPVFDAKLLKEVEERKNKVYHGIEVNKRGEHVAFFVKTDADLMEEYIRIPARGEESGKLMAWMVYGDKHRINHHRGIPQIAAILEKVDKLDRYTEASVAGAEERAKIAFSIEHNATSTGENPLIDQMKRNIGNATGTTNPYDEAATVSKNITRTTGKQAFNMPIGSKLNALDSKQEDNYEPFFQAVFVQLCAAIDIPPEVALQKYSSNYSASRAAINGWGYIVDIYRKDFAFDFYKNFYKLWLEVEVLKGKIKSPGFLKAAMEKDEFILEAFCTSRFTGINMPHIDPLKEVKAVREMLGDRSKGEVPLINHDIAAEQLNQGEWFENYSKYKEEIKEVDFTEAIVKTDEPSKTKPKSVE